MHGIVSLLPEPASQQVQDLWRELAEEGLTGIRVTPYPHFSWQIGAQYPLEALEDAFQALAARTRPFSVSTAGLGLFSGERPVLFIPLVKTAPLMAFHRQVWHLLQPIGRGISHYYAPDSWCPHISLAYDDLTRDNIGAVMRRLSFRSYNWQMNVNHLAYLHEDDGQIGELRLKVDFS